MSRKPIRVCLLTTVAALLAACGSSAVRDGPPSSGSVAIPDLPGDAVPRPEPKSRYGNGPVYEVFGKRYRVMDTSHGYNERGVASWYGRKFHGRLTSSREPYDMYEMTAAHKTLPLPTFVRVRNLSNNRSVVVRVNDRGPFAHNRIIDLSYAAALKLGMVTAGTSLVEVEAIGFGEPPQDHPVRAATPVPATPETVPELAPEPAPESAPEPAPAAGPATIDEDRIFVQVGAYGSEDNARRQLSALHGANILTAFIDTDAGVTPPLYRVRIGPIRGIVQYDILVEELENLGIPNPYLVAQ